MFDVFSLPFLVDLCGGDSPLGRGRHVVRGKTHDSPGVVFLGTDTSELKYNTPLHCRSSLLLFTHLPSHSAFRHSRHLSPSALSRSPDPTADFVPVPPDVDSFLDFPLPHPRPPSYSASNHQPRLILHVLRLTLSFCGYQKSKKYVKKTPQNSHLEPRDNQVIDVTRDRRFSRSSGTGMY